MPTLTTGRTSIPYSIRRSSRARRQRIVVTPGGVEVVAPVDRSLADIRDFVHSKRRWVYDQREQIDERLADSPWPEHFVTGAKIPYRGRRMRLIVRATPRRDIAITYRNGFRIHVPRSLKDGRWDEAVRSALVEWFQARIENDARAFVRRYAAKLGEHPRAIRVKEQKYLWGSCGRDRIINLNWRLIFMPKTVLEYVVVHEVCHLRHRSHSAEFWATVRSLLPDYEPRKAWLAKHSAGFDL
jgi:predicted metal-dependent hydrolase